MTTENTLLGKMVDLFEEPEGASNVIDLDFDPMNEDGWNSFAVLNAYRMWLASRRGDYIRENPDDSGYFQYALNNKYTFEKSNEENVKNDIVRLTAERFPLIRLVDCQVKANQMTKKWEIKVIIEDLNSGNFVSMEESLDVVNKETSQGYLEIE